MLKHALAFLIVICFSAPASYTNPQIGDARNLMWCSAKSGRTVYFSAWFRYSEGKMDAHRAEFQKDTIANYNLKTIEAPICHSYELPQNAADAYDASVKAQKKAGLRVVTTGWMPPV